MLPTYHNVQYQIISGIFSHLLQLK